MNQSLEKIERRRRQLQFITYFIILILTVAVISLLFFVDSLIDMFANLKYNIFLRIYLLVFIIASILYLAQKEHQQDTQTKLLMAELQETSNRLADELREDIFLNQISHKLANLSSDEALDYLFKSTSEFLDADGGALTLKDSGNHWELSQIATGDNTDDDGAQLAQAVAEWVEQTGRSFIYPNDNVSAAKLSLDSKKIASVLGVALRLKGKLFGVITFWRSKVKNIFNQHELNLLQIVARQTAATAFNRQLAKEKDNQFREILRLLARAIDDRDPDSKNHSQRSTEYALQIARQLDLSTDEIETIEVASILQNVGYLALPSEIFSQASLTEEENARLEDHPRYGAKMLRSLKFPRRITDVVLLHHEWADGSRPNSMPPNDIPIGAKIIAVADAFVNLTALQADGKVLFVREAISKMRQLGEGQFDTEILDALTRTVETEQSLSA